MAEEAVDRTKTVQYADCKVGNRHEPAQKQMISQQSDIVSTQQHMMRREMECTDQDRQENEIDDKRRTIDDYATAPLTQVVSLGLEDENLVTEVSDCPIEKRREDRGNDVAVRDDVCQHCIQDDRSAEPEQRVSHANQQIASKLVCGNVFAEASNERDPVKLFQ